MIPAFQNAVSYLCFAVLAAMACVCFLVGFRQVGRWLQANLRSVSLAVFATAAAIATCEAQKRGGEGGSGASVMQPIPGAETNARWRAHGAFEDVFYLPASNWWARMPGGGWIDRLRIRSSGGFQAKGASGGSWTNYPPPFAQKLSLAPEANWSQPSLFWHATTPSNTLVMTWLGGLNARAHTNQVDFQAELFNDGSYDYRYADHAEHFPASLPFDLDGDGLENTVDPDPLTPGPDAHGTNAEWYNTVCSNVLEAVAQERDPPDGGGTRSCASVELSWRAGVNSNAYYFVDVVTERGPAPIYFIGDRDSRLGNPVVVANAFETNRVPLLIGVDYSITSDTPFAVSFPVDYMYPDVETNDPCRAHIRWPLNFVFTESIGASNRVYTVTVEPYDPGGVFEWDDSGGGVPMRGGSSGGGSACVSYGINSAMFSCSSACTCGAGCKARGRYIFEVAEFALEGGECRCGFDDPPPDNPPSSHDPSDPPSLTITFSKQAVLFEDAFENSPGVTEPRRSTRVRLTIDVYAGAQGGALWISDMNMDKLTPAGGSVSLPYSQNLAAGESYHASGVYEGLVASDSAGDVGVTGAFVETGTENYFLASNHITAVRIDLKTRRDAPGNACIGRHTHGIGEEFWVYQYPSAPVVTPEANDASISDLGGVKRITWGVSNAVHALTLRIADLEYAPLLNVLVPTGIEGVNAEAKTNGLPAGIAGGIQLRQRFRVLPLSVSFGGISVEEVPCSEAIPPDGYFLYTPTNIFYRTHTRAAGAGRWIGVENGNYVGGSDTIDKVGYLGPLPRITENGSFTTDPSYGWLGGSLTWKVPFGWQTNPSPTPLSDPVDCFADNVRQIFRITAGGDFSIEKLGHIATRTLSNDVTLTNCPPSGVMSN